MEDYPDLRKKLFRLNGYIYSDYLDFLLTKKRKVTLYIYKKHITCPGYNYVKSELILKPVEAVSRASTVDAASFLSIPKKEQF